MPRYWVIAPFQSNKPELFDTVWQFDVDNNVISIGWHQLGDVSAMSREELSAAVAIAYPDKPAGTRGLYVNMLWAFYHDVSPGDIVIARRGRKTLVAVGRVTRSAVYSPGKNPAVPHPSFLEVEWSPGPRDKVFSRLVFPMQTIAEITEDVYQVLGGGVLNGDGDGGAIENPSEFVLEKYLEDFIVSNFKTIFKGRLEVYEESDTGDGQQYDTNEIGRIDILAVERETDSFVVIELKKGRPSDQVVGQVLRYMGWVKKNLCKDDQDVKGLVICREHDPRLTYALEMVNNIDVRYYSVSFALRDVP